ncbi:MAG: hypothetical protein Kow0032_14220 [Methyloligellaceae bacterium]
MKRKALLAGFAAALALFAGIAALRHTQGPASRCEGFGGHFMVGPGGETACIDPTNFLPMDIPEGAETRR